jgi:DASH complex subunit SPC19
VLVGGGAIALSSGGQRVGGGENLPYGPSPPSHLFLMSRQSVRPGSHRESIFTGGASEAYRADTVATCPPSLFDCVNSLQDCFNEARPCPVYFTNKPHTVSYQANEAHRILRNGTSDLPRMNKVLESEQVGK